MLEVLLVVLREFLRFSGLYIQRYYKEGINQLHPFQRGEMSLRSIGSFRTLTPGWFRNDSLLIRLQEASDRLTAQTIPAVQKIKEIIPFIFVWNVCGAQDKIRQWSLRFIRDPTKISARRLCLTMCWLTGAQRQQ